MDEFEKETLKFFEDIVSYCAENQACISVDNTIIEYFKVAIKAIRDKKGACYNCGLIGNAPTVESDKELKEQIKTYKNAYKIMSDAFENEVRKNTRPQGDGEQVLQIARHCESISKRGGNHAGEYHRIAQHLKKSAGHLLALERNGNT